MRRCLNKTFAALLIVSAFTLLSAIHAEAQTNYNSRDDKFTVLGLKRAKEAYEYARAQYEQNKQLFDKQLISKLELDRSRNIFSDSEVNYQQSLLAVLFENQYVTVSKAVKYQARDGRKHVRLTLANTSGGGAEFRKLINLDDELFRSLQPDIINNVYVSLLNDVQATIGQPYEAKIDELRFGEPATIDFTLLQDLDFVTVSMIYGSGTQRSMKIFLQKDATVNKVVVQSEQFSQEAELGGSASFGLALELFSGVTNTYKLEVVNLTQQIDRTFMDPTSQARLSQFKFTESVNTKRVNLQINLPDRPGAEVIMDQPIPFYVLVIPADQSEQLGDLRAKQLTQEEIDRLSVGYARLELIPRGKGKLLVRAPQLFRSIKPDETVEVAVDVINEGTRRLDNVVMEVDPPLGWTKKIEPELITSLAIGEEKRVKLSITPAENVSVGRYEIRVRTSGMSDNQPVNGEDKTITVEVQAQVSLAGTGLIVLLIVGVIAGIVVFGIRLSRR